MTFQVGDRVRNLTEDDEFPSRVRQGEVGTVLTIDPDESGLFGVYFNEYDAYGETHDGHPIWWMHDDEIEAVDA